MKRSRNYNAFIWHAFFLSLTSTFTEINTVISSLLIKAGGSTFHLGLLTAIMTGIPPLSKILFAGAVASDPRKKPYLLAGVNARILALAVIAFLLSDPVNAEAAFMINLVFVLMFIFAVAGSFAGISYTDILGKSLDSIERHHFFVVRQYFQSGGILLSALIARQIMHILPYPDNYVLLFSAAAVMLLIASGGFWAIREPVKDKKRTDREPLHRILMKLPAILREDRALRNYIILQNISGVGMMMLPFYIALARESFGLDSSDVGNYLLLQITGSVLSVKLWSHVNSKGGYRRILSLCLLLSSLLPLYAYSSSMFTVTRYAPVFFLSGFALSARSMSFEALFIQITTDENRALHAGIAGVSNIIGALIPVLSGILILHAGFLPVFIGASVIMLAGRRVLKNIY